MTFQDIFTSSFLERVDAVPLLDMALALVLACLVGLFVVFVYRRTYSGVMYSASFGATLVALTLVTTLVILAVSSNVLLSLGMVGALSIVRFRTAIKDPIDTAFIFWAVGEGLALGVGFFDAAIIGGVVIGIFVLLLSAFKVRSAMPYLLVLHYSEAANGPIKQMIKQLPGARIRSKTAQRDGIELTLELRLRDNETGFVEKFLRVEGVYDASLISYQGDLVS